MAFFSFPYSERNTIEKCLQNLSESVFVGLCKILGTSELVTMRRDVTNINEMIENEVNKKKFIMMISGSYGEGFRLLGSDQDYMYWRPNEQVIWDESLFKNYNEQNQTLIVSDNSESPPGFTLLWLPRNHIKHRCILSSCVVMKNKHYISSSKYKQTMPSYIIRNPIIHGPCKSGFINGVYEFDEAHTFQSRYWPPSASSWVSRCRTWPKPHVVRDIVKKGCHFVAIGHSLGNHVDNEWRISFSLAEKQLIYSMNHCQFLIYGLLKLFLKDVINNGLNSEDKILCSYHLKTAVFWAIQQNKISHWSPQNLLQCFWVCFKLILKWVYKGVCPNFFIPENNMFLSKVNGDSQTILFLRLYTLYERGVVSCLLHCPSIRAYVLNVLYNPRLTVSIDEHMMIPEFTFDQLLLTEIDMNFSIITNANLRTIEKLINEPLTQYQVAALQDHTIRVLLSNAFILHNKYIGRGGNNQRYITDKISCNMLKLAARFGCISDALYLAMYYYKTSRYTEALSIIEMTKVRLSHAIFMLFFIFGDRDKYAQVVGGKSWSTKMREGMAGQIMLFKDIGYINELLIEQSESLHQVLQIPPFALIHMLEILCYIHVDSTRVQTALNDLRNRIQNNIIEGVLYRDISWQILGICYYMTGNFNAAFYAFQKSLVHIPLQQIQTATIIRIIILIYQFF
ncbi:uncharacterized protein LOC134238515 [Saccostrea cucullata]|uniref:uncharacterized protein LOC134238515 n=1 Tax=Saccostrea cuccullata TaxID=36930 RepID=UPI002ECFE189